MEYQTLITPLQPGNGPANVRSIFESHAPVATSDSSPVRRIALIGTYPPRKCGIATFTADLCEQLGTYHPNITIDVYPLLGAQDDAVSANDIRADDPESYARAARRINESGVDAIWLQHEFGIFGGADGDMVCDFVNRLAAPLILTCHTVLAEPSSRQETVLCHLVSRASQIMVMSRHSVDLLATRYRASRSTLTLIEHGAPDRPFGRQEQFKENLGLQGRKVLMTFGLLGPGKGLETAIAALPRIVERHPDVLYRIVGATHPNLVTTQGERYRERLMNLAAQLGVDDHIAWDNRFLDTPELLDQLEACDIYITPYPGLQQSTSGTLSYAVALGKALISTPYVHARELLADDVGRLVPPGSSDAIADEVIALFDAPSALSALQRRAYARGRESIWPRFAEAAAQLVERAIPPLPERVPISAVPGLRGVFAMSDSTGIFQHSIGMVPDRNHGYCLDDNARALMLMNVAEALDPAEHQRWSLTYASFIQHAWNPDRRQFRNFMHFERTWCEEVGSEDSNGRALWALGDTVERHSDPDIQAWAMQLYNQVCEALGNLDSPRTVAFVGLGACAMLRSDPDHEPSRKLAEHCGTVLSHLLGGGRRPDWVWFETILAYDNPRLSQALIDTGVAMNRPDWIEEGLDTLRWICGMQISSNGHFRPVGSEGFGQAHTALPFDQQPLEAQAAIDACAAAYEVTGNRFFRSHAEAAYAWFFGRNDRGAVLADMATGRCRDGVTPRGANANSGAESVLAFQLSSWRIRSLAGTWNNGTEGSMCDGSREVLA